MSNLRRLVVSKLRPKVIDAAVWKDFADAVQALSANQKTQILTAAKRNEYEVVGKRLVQVFMSAMETKISAEADTILADNALDATELERLLG